MADPIPTRELVAKRDLGAVLFFGCYVRLMMRELGTDDTNQDAVNAMVLPMVMPMNAATNAMWCALMNDDKGRDEALERFKACLEGIKK